MAKVDTHQVNIGGTDRPFRLGIIALREFERITDKRAAELAEYVGSGTLEAQVNFIYCGLVGGAKSQRLPVDFTPDDVLIWADDNPDVFAEITNKVMGAPAEPVTAGE